MWEASAPSNIALIKYMGKVSATTSTVTSQGTSAANAATNSSLSLTLPHLVSTVVIEKSYAQHDQWMSLDDSLVLSDLGRTKFLKHFAFLKQQWGVENQFFTLRSKNNFPADCGIASSASRFAALTKCAAGAFKDLTGKSLSVVEQARLSRRGSGSSCRSFFEGFVAWDGNEDIKPVSSLHQHFTHQVFIVSDSKKAVSSSEAHLRVRTSALMKDRSSRVAERTQKLTHHLQEVWDWQQMFEVCWAEFWDMHALFETSQPSFGYFTPKSLEVINAARDLWKTQPGPLVTMDAGPNVHLLWQKSQTDLAQAFALSLNLPFYSSGETL